MLSTEELHEGQANPLDTLEVMVSQNEWPYERLGNEEIVAAVIGEWCDFHMRYIWLSDKNILQFSGQLDIKVHERKRGAVLEVMARINERLDMGHFGIWSDDETLMFRHSLIPPTIGIDVSNICDLVTRTVIAEINRYYPVFQFVIWGGKSPSEAIEAAMLETIGNA
ncbi:MAG: YbjN domain-containing protein [Emcibacteraceae bacterium]